FSALIAYPYFGIWGPVEHYLGGLAMALGDLDAAGRHLRAAAEVSERLGAQAWTVRNDLHRVRLAARIERPETGPARCASWRQPQDDGGRPGRRRTAAVRRVRRADDRARPAAVRDGSALLLL